MGYEVDEKIPRTDDEVINELAVLAKRLVGGRDDAGWAARATGNSIKLNIRNNGMGSAKTARIFFEESASPTSSNIVVEELNFAESFYFTSKSEPKFTVGRITEHGSSFALGTLPNNQSESVVELTLPLTLVRKLIERNRQAGLWSKKNRSLDVQIPEALWLIKDYARIRITYIDLEGNSFEDVFRVSAEMESSTKFRAEKFVDPSTGPLSAGNFVVRVAVEPLQAR